MVYWNCDVKNKRCTHFLPLVAAIIWFWQSKFPVEMRLWVPVLAWYLKTLLNIVSEQLRWAKSSNVLERLHICSCDSAAHWHSSSSESERSLERVSSFESVRSTLLQKRGLLLSTSCMLLAHHVKPCTERKVCWSKIYTTIVGRVVTNWSMLILIIWAHPCKYHGSIQQQAGKEQ